VIFCQLDYVRLRLPDGLLQKLISRSLPTPRAHTPCQCADAVCDNNRNLPAGVGFTLVLAHIVFSSGVLPLNLGAVIARDARQLLLGILQLIGVELHLSFGDFHVVVVDLRP